VEDGLVVAEEQFEHGLQHAAMILPMIDRLTRARAWSPSEVNEIYVSAGPGSFTGLRIGITLAKTMALATGVKLVAVPTVRVLAENAPAEARHVIIVLDAKRDQIFTARLERGVAPPARGASEGASGEGWIVREQAKLDSLTHVLSTSPRPVHLLGEGIPYHEKVIPKDDLSIIVTPPEFWRPRAAVVATLGQAMADRGEFTDPDKLTPIYIRRPEAEEKYDAAQSRKS
jgi:tRNA threonylcarbamoyladenosine biosynthesis protein TsaB